MRRKSVGWRLIAGSLAAVVSLLAAVALPGAATASPYDKGLGAIGDEVSFEDGSPAARVKVDLFTSDDRGRRVQFLGTTRTDSNGNYGFAVDPGCYKVTFVAPDGHVFTRTNGRYENSRRICVSSGETNWTADAVLKKAGPPTTTPPTTTPPPTTPPTTTPPTTTPPTTTPPTTTPPTTTPPTTTPPTTTPPPPEPAKCRALIGPSSITEGSVGEYRVQLDKPALQDRSFHLALQHGTAKWINAQPGVQSQDIMWGGYYTVWGVWFTQWYYLSTVYGQVPTSTFDMTSRPMVGPADASWDFSLVDGYHNPQNTTVQVVTVKAGQTESDSFKVKAWAEKITVDQRGYTGGNYSESGEYFGVHSYGKCNDLRVHINDNSWYNFVSPLTLDLDNDGIETTAASNDAPKFDLLGNGEPIASGWTSDALLAHDADGSGTIDSGTELFGGAIGDGYGKLAEFDSNDDGVVDADDDRFGELSAWTDADQDRFTDPGELLSLAEVGVTSISVSYSWDGSDDGNGNFFGETGTATMADGTTISMVDVYFGTMEAAATTENPSPAAADTIEAGNTMLILLLGAAGLGIVGYAALAARRRRNGLDGELAQLLDESSMEI